MQKNYIILCHKNPLQLKRLIDKLNNSSSSFYIHIDKKVEISDFINVISNYSNVKFIENRENCIWGDISLVKATLNCIREISLIEKGYCILLSGQDYPITSNTEINNYLERENENDFIEISKIKEVFPTEWSMRINDYKYNISNIKGKYIIVSPLSLKTFFSVNLLKNTLKVLIYKRDLNFISLVLKNLLKKRVITDSIEHYAGGQWWALKNSTLDRILNFIDKNPNYLKYHEFTFAPDEMFFQSILAHLAKNDNSIKFKDSITYLNWQKLNCELPVTFTTNDFNELTSQPKNKLFARKFDNAIDENILNKLDQLKN